MATVEPYLMATSIDVPEGLYVPSMIRMSAVVVEELS